ncbi:Prame Family Member 19 [Manis pentadactyla]|nr:Prame Family Member 19 [Manis pentadactyla]
MPFRILGKEGEWIFKGLSGYIINGVEVLKNIGSLLYPMMVARLSIELSTERNVTLLFVSKIVIVHM